MHRGSERGRAVKLHGRSRRRARTEHELHVAPELPFHRHPHHEPLFVERGARCRGRAQHPLAGVGPQVPYSDRLVHAGTDEGVVQRRHGQRRDAAAVPAEVAQVAVVVHAQVAQRLVPCAILARAQDGVRRVREADAVDAVLFAEDGFGQLAAGRVVHVDRLVVAPRHHEVLRAVEVHRVHARGVVLEDAREAKRAHGGVIEAHRRALHLPGGPARARARARARVRAS